jgi:hypothetical protein
VPPHHWLVSQSRIDTVDLERSSSPDLYLHVAWEIQPLPDPRNPASCKRCLVLNLNLVRDYNSKSGYCGTQLRSSVGTNYAYELVEKATRPNRTNETLRRSDPPSGNRDISDSGPSTANVEAGPRKSSSPVIKCGVADSDPVKAALSPGKPAKSFSALSRHSADSENLEDLSNEYDTEVKVMAEVRGYFQVCSEV